MDCNSINIIIVKEIDALDRLLKLLDEQHGLLISNKIIELEQITIRMQLCNKEVAESEVERRKITKNESMKDIIFKFNNKDLENNYRKIIKLLHEIEVQKESNDILIKMGLGFSNRMMRILNPDRSIKTYNSFGKYK